MSFSPNHGLWSLEDFENPGNVQGTDLTQQNVTGGYVTLIPSVDKSVSFFHPWAPLSGWDVNNSMSSRATIAADFTITGGSFGLTGQDSQSGYQKMSAGGGMWEIFTPYPVTMTGSSLIANSGFEDNSVYSDQLGGTPGWRTGQNIVQRYLTTTVFGTPIGGAGGTLIGDWSVSGAYAYLTDSTGVYIGDESGAYTGPFPPYMAIGSSTDPDGVYITGNAAGAYISSIQTGKYSLVMAAIPDAWLTGLFVANTGISLKGERRYRASLRHRQPYQSGNTDKNLLMTIVGYTGTKPWHYQNYVAFWDSENGSWSSTMPGNNIAPGDNVESFSFLFETTGYPGAVPTEFNLLLAKTGWLSTNDTNVNFSVVDNVVVNELNATTGQVFEYIGLDRYSPNGWFYTGTKIQGNAFTIEFDVASMHTVGTDKIGGMASGQLSGKAPLSGVVNHGVYISNGVNWDYLECRPDGIRSYNHPELAIPIGLTSPRRFRVGVNGSDIFILAEDGRGLAGIGQFDTDVAKSKESNPVLAFGSPIVGTDTGVFSFPPELIGPAGSAGLSFWDNIKLYSNGMVLEVPDGLENLYSISKQSLYTETFDAGIALSKWIGARIQYVPSKAGTTVVYPEFMSSSGVFTTVTGAAVTLVEGQEEVYMDLSPVPAAVQISMDMNWHDSRDANERVPTSAIRFRIDQNSTDGYGPAPLVGSIAVEGARDEPLLDAIPNWKPINRQSEIQLYVKTGTFLSRRPGAKPHTTFFFQSPLELTGNYQGQFIEDSIRKLTGNIVGTGQIVAGKFETAFQNYKFGTGFAVTGSEAAQLYGLKSVTNYMPDPHFDRGFAQLNALTGRAYFTGLVGEIGTYMNIPWNYTGWPGMELRRHEVHRGGYSPSGQKNYAQRVNVNGPAGKYNCGVEAIVPSGIMRNGQEGVFTFNLKVFAGNGVTVYGTGDLSFSGVNIPSDSYLSDYAPVSIPVTMLGSGRGYLGIAAQEGDTASFVIDDLALAPVDRSYLQCTGVPSKITPFGSVAQVYVSVGQANPQPSSPERAATMVSMDLWLDVYPTGNNVLLEKKRYQDNRGLKFWVDVSGYPVCEFDTSHRSFYDGSIVGGSWTVPTGDWTVGSKTITGEEQIPLGRWVNVGFAHQSHAYRRHGSRSISGQYILASIACSNRAYLTLDGRPVASEDCMTIWPNLSGGFETTLFTVDAAPVCSFIADGTGTLTFASGLYCKVDNVHVNRAPSSDIESALYIDAARQTHPYFVPDVYLKPGHIRQTYGALSQTGLIDTNSPSIYTQSVWNLDGPGDVNVWDHGTNRNHLLITGTTTKELGVNPYDGRLASTRFATGVYAVAKYSCGLERFSNYGGLGKIVAGSWAPYVYPIYPQPIGNIHFGGYFYPRQTGVMMEMVYNERSPDGHALVIELVADNIVRAGRRLEDGSYRFYSEITGSANYTGTWVNVVYHNYTQTAFTRTGEVSTAAGAVWVDGVAGNTGSVSLTIDAGFRYQGNINDPDGRSAVLLGRGPDVNIVDAFVATDHLQYSLRAGGEGPIDVTGVASTGNKGGRYDKIYYNATGFTGEIRRELWHKAVIVMPKSDTAKTTRLWAGVNEYATDEGEHLDGFALHTSSPFIEAEAYAYGYDDSQLRDVFGDTDSPIRIGFTVPEHAINLARLDSPEYSVENSLTTIDLSNSNPNNLSTFRGGQFTLFRDGADVGLYILKNDNGNFESINNAGTWLADTVTIKDLVLRANHPLVGNTYYTYAGWVTTGLFTYDAVYRSFGGTGCGGLAVGANANCLGFHAIRGTRSLLLGDFTSIINDPAAGYSTGISLSPGKPHKLTFTARTFFTGAISKPNLLASVVGWTGTVFNLTGDVFYDFGVGAWVAGSPLFGKATQNLTITNLTGVDLNFTTTGFPGSTPVGYNILLSCTGFGGATEGQNMWVAIDDVRLYEKAGSLASGSYRGINTPLYSGQTDITLVSQIDTDDIRLTSMSVADPNADTPQEAYYAYLIGRGEWGVKIPDAFPHPTGELLANTTGLVADRYLNNIERIRSRIQVKGSKGTNATDFKWDILSSPFTYGTLADAVQRGEDLFIDGVGSGQYSGMLENGVFSVVMISPELPPAGSTIWIHYPGYNFEDGTIDPARREIYNPIPLMRERLPHEQARAGQFFVTQGRDNPTHYDVTIYGVQSGLAGNFQ